MARLLLFLLGTPRIECDGLPIEVDTRKAIALLVYLVVTKQRHSRETLAALLWPDAEEARSALRRTLSSLHRALAGEWLVADRESIGLTSGADYWLDVDQFRALLTACQGHGHRETEECPACLGPLTEAVELYRDDFLAGFSLRDSPGFDEWQFFQAESLRRDLGRALEKLVHCRADRHEFDAAIAHAHRWLALDPLQEAAHRDLMRLYAWAGQRPAALRQYRECVRVLERELGVGPLDATTRLYETIKENHPPRLPPLQSSAPAPPRHQAPSGEGRGQPLGSGPPSFPLVGRATERSILLRTYDSIQDGGHWLVLEGEAGIGKTRLAESMVDRARDRGASVIAVRCDEGQSDLAYAPFVDALRAVARRPDRADWIARVPVESLAEAARLLPDLANLRPGTPAPPPLGSPGAQSRFFEGIAQILVAASDGPRPGILFIDDLHWVDPSSLDVISYLVHRLPDKRLCILVAWRPEHLPAMHRLRLLFAEARRGGRATMIALKRLDCPAVQDLVQAFLSTRKSFSLPTNRPGAGDLVSRLYRETEGLPFFLVEYLSAIAGEASATPPAEWPEPSSIRDLLRSRLATVSEPGWQVLTAAAVIGRSFDFDTVRDASGRSEDETVAAIEELISRGVVVEVAGEVPGAPLATLPGPGYDFSHDKLRELVYAETSLARRRLLHRRVAEAIVARVRARREAGSLASAIAHHYQLAGAESQAAEYFEEAGGYARGLYAHAEALAHFRSALALGHPDASGLHEAIGDVQTWLGDYVDALKSYETAASLRDQTELAGLEHKLGNLYQRRGDWELAESHYRAALAALGDDGPAGERSRLDADLSLNAHRRGLDGPATELAGQALALAERAGDARALAQAHNLLGILASSAGDSARARAHLESSLTLADRLEDPGARVAALNNLALVYRESGEVDRALEAARIALTLGVRQGDRHRIAALHNNLADLLHAAGRSEEAMSHLKQAVALFAEIGADVGTMQPEIWKLTEW